MPHSLQIAHPQSIGCGRLSILLEIDDLDALDALPLFLNSRINNIKIKRRRGL